MPKNFSKPPLYKKSDIPNVIPNPIGFSESKYTIMLKNLFPWPIKFSKTANPNANNNKAA